MGPTRVEMWQTLKHCFFRPKSRFVDNIAYVDTFTCIYQEYSLFMSNARIASLGPLRGLKFGGGDQGEKSTSSLSYPEPVSRFQSNSVGIIFRGWGSKVLHVGHVGQGGGSGAGSPSIEMGQSL